MSDVSFENERSYYLNIREFPGGHLEAVTKAVRPLQMEAAKQRFEESFARFRRPGGATNIPETERQANHSRAVRRARQSIRFLVKMMQADRLLTLTYRENIQDREQVKVHFKEFLRLLRLEVGEWSYVAVLERQERGAYHIHCAVKGWQRITVIRRCWYKAVGGSGEEQGGETLGQVDVTRPRHSQGRSGRSWRSDKLAGYITKYLEKTFDETTAEKRRYWASRDLRKPEAKRIWLGAAGPAEAIAQTVRFLQTIYDLRVDWDMWLSDDNTCFWLAGRLGGAGDP